jgi:hypothetical protein
VAEYLGSLLVAALIVLSFPLERNGWQLLLMFTLLLFTTALGLQSWRLAHYAAPAAGLALLVTLRVVRRVGCCRFGRARAGKIFVRALCVAVLGMLAAGWWPAGRAEPRQQWQHKRARIAADLARTGEKHLVIVRYAPQHDVHAEWVYNAADIDASPVVWAAEMEAAANARLLEYFKGRRVWLVEADRPDMRAVPYGPTDPAKPATP